MSRLYATYDQMQNCEGFIERLQVRVMQLEENERAMTKILAMHTETIGTLQAIIKELTKDKTNEEK